MCCNALKKNVLCWIGFVIQGGISLLHFWRNEPLFIYGGLIGTKEKWKKKDFLSQNFEIKVKRLRFGEHLFSPSYVPIKPPYLWEISRDIGPKGLLAIICQICTKRYFAQCALTSKLRREKLTNMKENVTKMAINE